MASACLRTLSCCWMSCSVAALLLCIVRPQSGPQKPAWHLQKTPSQVPRCEQLLRQAWCLAVRLSSCAQPLHQLQADCEQDAPRQTIGNEPARP